MRAWVLSDLHVDAGEPIELTDHPDCDVILMAGDLCDGTYDPVSWLLATFADDERSRLLYVPGNHDFYGLQFDEARQRLIELESRTGIHVLDRAVIMIDGQRFVGATLWSNLRLPDRSYGVLGDIDYIPGFTADEWRRRHVEDLAYLRAYTFPGDVVITHHAPSREGLDPRMQHDPRLMGFASGYATDLDQVVQELAPAAWVHGHTHISRQYQIGGVAITTNALGRGFGTHFNPCMTIEIGGYDPRP